MCWGELLFWLDGVGLLWWDGLVLFMFLLGLVGLSSFFVLGIRVFVVDNELLVYFVGLLFFLDMISVRFVISN